MTQDIQQYAMGISTMLEHDRGAWIRYEDHLAKLEEARKEERACEWVNDEGGDFDDTWDTECGNAFVLNEGTPKENDMNYCAYCGGKLKQKTTKEGENNEPTQED